MATTAKSMDRVYKRCRDAEGGTAIKFRGSMQDLTHGSSIDLSTIERSHPEELLTSHVEPRNVRIRTQLYYYAEVTLWRYKRVDLQVLQAGCIWVIVWRTSCARWLGDLMISPAHLLTVAMALWCCDVMCALDLTGVYRATIAAERPCKVAKSCAHIMGVTRKFSRGTSISDKTLFPLFFTKSFKTAIFAFLGWN